MQDEQWLGQALDLARASASTDGGPFGALLVREGRLVSEGTNLVTATPDPTAHAEVVAIRRACRELGAHVLDGAVLYCSCEPCPMCLAATLWARIDRVVYAADRRDAAAAGFSDEDFYDLFTTPRDRWTQLAIEQRRLPTAQDPFDAWRANAARVEY